MKTVNKINIDEFVNDYLKTAAWVTCDSITENHEFTKASVLKAKQDCKIFIDKVFAAFDTDTAERLINQAGNDLGFLAAHDFFLTRNGHGSGFWDKEEIYGIIEAEILTRISKEMGINDVMHERGPKSKLIIE